jgi:hypothetical protein
MKCFSLILGSVLFVGINGCDNSTSPKVNISLIGTWINVDTSTTSVQENESDTLHRTTLVTTTTTLTFHEDGTLNTLRNLIYNPKVSFSPDTQVTYIGTWKIIGDTLIRDTWPGSVASIESSKFTLESLTLKLYSLAKGNSYVQSFSRNK